MLCPARLLETALGFTNANDLLETHPKCFREKSKQLLLEDINMQLGHKIKEPTMRCPSVQSLLSAADGFYKQRRGILALAPRCSMLNHDSCKALIPH